MGTRLADSTGQGRVSPATMVTCSPRKRSLMRSSSRGTVILVPKMTTWVILVPKRSQRKQNFPWAPQSWTWCSTFIKRWARRNLKEKLGWVNMYSWSNRRGSQSGIQIRKSRKKKDISVRSKMNCRSDVPRSEHPSRRIQDYVPHLQAVTTIVAWKIGVSLERQFSKKQAAIGTGST